MAAGVYGDSRPGFGPGRALSMLLRVISGVLAIYFVVTILILAINFLLQIFGANVDGSFATWIISHSHGPMRPFNGMFPTYHVFGSSTFDTSMFAAILIYAIIGTAVTSLLAWFSTLINS